MTGIGVLLVEDERLLDRVVTDALRTIGLACETTHSVEDALQRLSTQQYGLMILDLRLQQGSGVLVLEQARRQHPDLPVIVVTAYTMTDDLQNALALGVDALLYKPFDIDTLLATVRALLQRRQVSPTYAVVQMAGAASAAKPLGGLQAGMWVSLKQGAASMVGRIQSLDAHSICVETKPSSPPNDQRWTLEWTGSDALYLCRTRLETCLTREPSMLWLFSQPSIIRRVQRRRYPRVAVHGVAFVSVAGRLQRATQATLLDLSERGACVALTEPLHQGAQVHLDGHIQTDHTALPFQREGVVRSVVAFVERGQPRYRVGVELERLSNRVVQWLREARLQRLTGASAATLETSALCEEP
ncbi:MAG: response regulator [Fimbriimonadales bacterium]